MRDILTSPKIEDMKRKRRMERRRLVFLITTLSIVLIGALAYFSFHPRITINSVVVTGTQIIDEPDVIEQVQKGLKGRYLYLFNRSNSFIYPHKKIYNNLLTKFTRIETLKVYRDNLTTLHVEIAERTGAFLYCGPTIPEIEMDIGENCYFINNNGYIFDKAPYFSGNLYFKYYLTQDSSVKEPLGSQMMDSGRFQELARFIDHIRTLGFKPIYITIDQEGVHTLYLDHVRTETTPKIIFRGEDDLETILDNLSTSLSQKGFSEEIKTKYSKLLYIDLRFKNKVLYKFNE